MIGKLTKCQSALHLINYLEQEKQKARILFAEGVTTVSKLGMARCFEGHIRDCGKERIKSPIGHIALAWSVQDRDKLTDENMVEYAREYMERMGIRNTQFVIVRHSCTEHPHLHIAYNRIDFDGKLINISNDWKRNREVCRELSEMYGFYIAPQRGMRKFRNLRSEDGRRQDMRLRVYDAYERSGSWLGFGELLGTAGVRMAFRMDDALEKITGVIFSDSERSYGGGSLDGGLSFEALDDMFGGELGGAAISGLSKEKLLRDEEGVETNLVPFEVIAELVLQPTVAYFGGGGGGNNSTETEDEKKRRRKGGEDEYRPRFHR